MFAKYLTNKIWMEIMFYIHGNNLSCYFKPMFFLLSVI